MNMGFLDGTIIIHFKQMYDVDAFHFDQLSVLIKGIV